MPPVATDPRLVTPRARPAAARPNAAPCWCRSAIALHRPHRRSAPSSSTTACCGRPAARPRTPPTPRALAAASRARASTAATRRRARAAAIDASRSQPRLGRAAGRDRRRRRLQPPCPAGSPEAGGGACVRVDVFRNQQRGNPLPTIFARPGRRGLAGRAGDRDRRGAVRQCHRLREAVRRSPTSGSRRSRPAVGPPTTRSSATTPAARRAPCVSNPDSYLPTAAGQQRHGAGPGARIRAAGCGLAALGRTACSTAPAGTCRFSSIARATRRAASSALPGTSATCSPQVIGPGNVVQARRRRLRRSARHQPARRGARRCDRRLIRRDVGHRS